MDKARVKSALHRRRKRGFYSETALVRELKKRGTRLSGCQSATQAATLYLTLSQDVANMFMLLK